MIHPTRTGGGHRPCHPIYFLDNIRSSCGEPPQHHLRVDGRYRTSFHRRGVRGLFRVFRDSYIYRSTEGTIVSTDEILSKGGQEAI